MFRSMLIAAACTVILAGCASAPVEPERLPWRDAAFNYRAGLVEVSRDELFRLDPELQAHVLNPPPEQLGPSQKLKHLMAVVFGPNAKRFNYMAGHSTTASQTWRLGRGDCLSLTVLTYAVARAMGMTAQMQEVATPVLFDRRGEFDFVNQHVNVRFPRAHKVLTEDAEARDVVVDFEPDFISPRPGRPLTESGIYARYLNNIATEHLALGDTQLAYAHYKAAIEADPAYAASYGNLALLYRKSALHAEAEQLLRRAMALEAEADVPLLALQQMLNEQGRQSESRRYESVLQGRQARDPYYWINAGVQALQEGDHKKAIRALEQAREMTGNFREVHAFLALAYWRAGEARRATEELSTLALLGTSEAGISKLRKKFKGQESQLQWQPQVQ
ncbi:tetratricopeptide repeat protein [Caenimonas koreensis]|nr:tetratricopeptide repeat protein [Caenimonas koreensis]